MYHAAETFAQHLGVSRSELYSKAVHEYIESRKAQAITEQLNRVYAQEDGTLDSELNEMQRLSLDEDDW